MTKIAMPEPVGVYKQNYGICWTSAGMLAEPEDGAELITTTQAQAYADAVRREALEEAAMIIDANAESCVSHFRIMLRLQAADIRALLPT